jgi:AAA family ATP:ADP antiporter
MTRMFTPRTPRSTEGRGVLLFFSYAFLLLVCYYVLKLLREPLLLEGGSAELKSYAQATIAFTLMLLVPAYGAAFRRTGPARLVSGITKLFAGNLVVFYALGRWGVDVGFAYYVFVGVFGVTMLAQFWAHAAHCFGVASGQRLFPVVMVGATFGGLAGPPLVNMLYPLLGAWNLMLASAALLLATVPLIAATRQAVPAPALVHELPGASKPTWNGFALLLRDRYLALLAVLIVTLNCVNTTGEYLLTALVLEHAQLLLAESPALSEGEIIAAFFSDYYFAVNALTAALQILLVGRVFRWLGVHGAMLILPVLALVGYGLLAFLPVFGVVRALKIVENSVDYSIMNTARHALYLPLSPAQQFQGKTAIDGFFWRLGDVAHAAFVFAGLHWLAFELQDFALLNLALSAVWIGVAVALGRGFRRRAAPALEPAVARLPGRTRRRAAAAVAATLVAAVPAQAQAGAPEALFDGGSPLELELAFDSGAWCRTRLREECKDTPATLIHRAQDGTSVAIDVTLRLRGRWRKETGDCRLPALFVVFPEREAAAQTPFAGHDTLPLTTHCRDAGSYEQYVLKEYFAYRALNRLTEKSLRVRLARITYRDAASGGRSLTRYAFFTEHFDSLAARHAARVWRPEAVDAHAIAADELATVALFQYLIGNTDWPVVYSHNVVALRAASGVVSVVPYDFDFSGLVDAAYAGPPPSLPIRSVRERVYRGFCEPAPNWPAVFALFEDRQSAIETLAHEVLLEPVQRERVLAYVASFYGALAAPERRAAIVGACRPPPSRPGSANRP